MTAGGGGQFSFGVVADVSNATQAVAQLEQRITSLGAAALRSLNLRFDIINKQQSAADIQAAEQAVNAMRTRLQARGIDVPIRVNIREAEKEILNLKGLAEGSLRGLFRGTGFGGGVPVGLGFGLGAATIVGAGQAVEALTRSLIGGFQAGIQYNSMLEQATLQLTRYTGSGQAASKVIADLTKYADATPFGTEETIKVGTELLRIADGNIGKMEELLKLTGALAVTNPYQGLEGASYAVRELLAGDTQSFADRFNVSRALLQQLRREATDTTEFVRLAVSAAGGNEQLIAGLSQTFQGRLSTIQSFIAQLGQSLTAGFFQQMSGAAGDATRSIEDHGDAWKDTAEGVGVAAATMVGQIGIVAKALLELLNLGVGLPNFEELGRQAREQRIAEDRARVPVQQLPEYDAAAQTIKAGEDAIHEQSIALDDVNLKLKDNAANLQRIGIEARTITSQYENQIRPLERQLAILQRPDFDRQRRIAQLDIGIGQASLAGLQAGPSPELQGQVAEQRVLLDVATRLQDIDNRRAEIAAQAAEAASRGKSALEQQAEAQEQVVRKLQEEHQAAQDARAVRLEGLREESQLVQNTRRERLDGLREELRLVSEARREVIDTLREQQRSQQELRNEQLDGLRESHRAEAEALQDLDRERESDHRSQMSRYQEQIEKLRDQLDAQKESGKSATERQLDALDSQERSRDRSVALADALRGVREADTIRSRLDRLRQLKELQHDQEVAKKREALQAQIEKEKEQREQRREQIQDKISALERKGREEDRAYQKERETARATAEDQQRAAQREERELAKTNQEQDRAEQKALRELEKSDRQASLAEAKTLREEERTAREADKAEQLVLRNEERTARDEDRKEQARIREEQKAEQALTKAAADQREAEQLSRQAAADERAARTAELELKRLDLEQSLISGQDTAALARAEGEKTRLEAIKAIEVAEGNITKARKEYDILGLQQAIQTIKEDEFQALQAVLAIKDGHTRIKEELELEKAELAASLDLLKQQVGAAKALQAELRGQPDAAVEGGEAAEGDGRIAGPVRVSSQASMLLGLLMPEEDKQRVIREYEDFTNDLFSNANERSATKSSEFAKNWVDGIVEGLTEGENSVLGSLGWYNDGIWDFLKQFWIFGSPSQKMEIEFAGGLVDGAVKGLTERGPEIVAAIKAPFEGADIGTAIEALKTDLLERWNGVTAGLDERRQGIIDSLQAPFQNFIDTYLPGLSAIFDGSGYNAVTSWIAGWQRESPVKSVSDSFNQLGGNFFNQLNEFFRGSGENAAASWTNGWSERYNDWIRAGWGAVMNVSAASQAGASRAVNTVQDVASAVGDTIGGVFSGVQAQAAAPSETYTNAFSSLTEGQRERLLQSVYRGEAVPEARHSGGQVGPGSLYQLQSGEWLAQFAQPGTVIPNGVMSRMGNTSTEGSSSSVSVSVNIHPGAVQVSTQGIDETGLSDRIGQRVVMAITGVIDEAQRIAPKPAKRTLPGA